MKGTLKERMLPAPVGGGFAMEGYWVWCGSVIKGDDGRYHMFASRWPKKYPMHPGWLIASEVVRASCDTPAGKYQFEEVVLPARGAQYWDGRSTHCPQITRADGKYVLYYTGMTHPFSVPASIWSVFSQSIEERNGVSLSCCSFRLSTSEFVSATFASQSVAMICTRFAERFLRGG